MMDHFCTTKGIWDELLNSDPADRGLTEEEGAAILGKRLEELGGLEASLSIGLYHIQRKTALGVEECSSSHETAPVKIVLFFHDV